MVTEISPVFGMTLVGIAEWIAIAIFISASLTGSFSLWSILQNKKQLETQNKIASANLVMELHEPWRKNDDFKKLLILLFIM